MNRRCLLFIASLVVGASALAQPGTLGPEDATLGDGEYYETHEVDMRAGAPVTIGVVSTAFDPYLVVVDPTGDAVFQVDDSDGHGLNVATTYTPAITGPHLVVVTSAWGGETGAYELTIEHAEDPNPLDLPDLPSDSIFGPADSGAP